MAYKKKVLNAISRSYTQRANEKALVELKEKYNVDFVKWCEVIGWKASASTLLNALNRKNNTTLKKLDDYRKETYFDTLDDEVD